MANSISERCKTPGVTLTLLLNKALPGVRGETGHLWPCPEKCEQKQRLSFPAAVGRWKFGLGGQYILGWCGKISEGLLGLLRPKLVRKPLYSKLRAPWLVLPWGLDLSSQMNGDVSFIAIHTVIRSQRFSNAT